MFGLFVATPNKFVEGKTFVYLRQAFPTLEPRTRYSQWLIRRRPFHNRDLLCVVRRARKADHLPARSQIGSRAQARRNGRMLQAYEALLEIREDPTARLLYQFKAARTCSKLFST
jgi:hypothetical protein